MSDEDAPLHGLRVLDLSAEPRGAWCGRLLAEQGADVVLVEPPGGNRWRHVGPFAGEEPGLELSLTFLHYYVGRRSVIVDDEAADGRALGTALAATADVILVDWHDRLALADAAAAANPRAIVAAITCHGRAARLLSRADVLIENFTPRVLPSLGFDEARLRELNPIAALCAEGALT